MKALEDLGYYCIDNLPPKMVAQTTSLLQGSGIERIGLTLDLRSGDQLGDPALAIQTARGSEQTEVLFLDARDEVLVRRFSETRRRHPFSRNSSLFEAIAAERFTLDGFREAATEVIDTSDLTVAQLKERITSAVSGRAGGLLAVNILSFGFKFGVPLEADLLFDVRFLRNPNYIEELRPLTGSDEAVAKYIETDPFTAPFLDRLFAMMDFLLPRYVAEGKAQVTIALGCTGGKHRSIYVARKLYDHLRGQDRLALRLDARDVNR